MYFRNVDNYLTLRLNSITLINYFANNKCNINGEGCDDNILNYVTNYTVSYTRSFSYSDVYYFYVTQKASDEEYGGNYCGLEGTVTFYYK